MSGLAAVLAGRRPAGVYRWHGAFEPAEVQHTVEHAGWEFVHLEGWGSGETKAAFLYDIGKALGFPAYYGQNLDALEDCLRDVEAEPGLLLLWDGWGPFARADEHAFRVALDILRARTEAGGAGAFAVLLRGDGPDLDIVPSLD
jgi:RNAse (barnase) inhibitor barstar